MLPRGHPRTGGLIAVGLLAAVLSGACQGVPTSEDQRRLGLLRERFGASYTFKLEWEFYLRVKSRTDSEPKLEELRAIFSTFWLEPDGEKRRDSNHAYLNAYDRTGHWMVQLFWDRTKRAIVAQRGREHY